MCAAPDPATSSGWGRRPLAKPWIASIWLVFLVPSLIDGLTHLDEVRGILGLLATLAFMIAYTWVFLVARTSLLLTGGQPPRARAAAMLALLVALAAAMIATIGEDATAAVVFVATTAVLVLPLRSAAPFNLALVVAVVLVSIRQDWSSEAGVALGSFLGSLAVFGMRTVVARNLQLQRAYTENTRLAVDNERNRFARDLHDILGHSLTVITVKAELAGRLIDVDPERARAEVADLERLSRDALADVRRAVEGYRDLTLPGELARARAALQAAEIEPVLPQATDIVPTDLRDLFAWTVREGVTNVLRHSGAQRCTIELGADRIAVIDDGPGLSAWSGAAPGAGSGAGTGLTGLRERAEAAGATVSTRELSPGFRLEVHA